MISRRSIIEQQQSLDEQENKTTAYRGKQQLARQHDKMSKFSRQQQQLGPTGSSSAGSSNKTYEDYCLDHDSSGSQDYAYAANQHHLNNMNEDDYRVFDPYSVHGEEDEDVWYSEERLFEDHLEEIFNKWRLLDDDIWCKLIIMEQNRRIGKAYARVPIVTIDGSHELSYDGHKLALNGFDNPAREIRSEECRKRIGKGIKIKMDEFGNILIKRLSKAGIYIKEWPSLASSNASSSNSSANSASSQTNALAGNQSAGGKLMQKCNSSSSNELIMPTRQQLIKNQMMLGAGGQQKLLSASNLSNSTNRYDASSASSSSNDSAICDEVLSNQGRLDLDRIYVMFDMKKFQANVSQELGRPYPDKRKLEQQCFSIVGLARDSQDILDLPCWVMVINIVAIEMLNERFANVFGARFPEALLMDRSAPIAKPPPSFVSIFDQQQHPRLRNSTAKEPLNKEEDPYSLPGNISSSDVKSSINDNNYGTTSSRNVSSKYYHANRSEMYPSQQQSGAKRHEQEIHRTKSNCNIYGQLPVAGRMLAPSSSGKEKYNNSSSIYSPGHMLSRVGPSSDQQVPPKLPPRDFVGKSAANKSLMHKSKSQSQLVQQQQQQVAEENIYSTGLGEEKPQQQRKSKKNRFLDSLKAPLDQLASKGGPSNRAASVLGASAAEQLQKAKTLGQSQANASQAPNPNGPAVSSGGNFAKTSAKNLKSFLGVKSGKSSKKAGLGESKKKLSSEEVDSVVDSNEEAYDSQQTMTTSSTGTSNNSYNDLDIPTPDYETDENIYALESTAYSTRGDIYATGGQLQQPQRQRDQRISSGNSTKEQDLYYSGFMATNPNGPELHSSRMVSRSQVMANNLQLINGAKGALPGRRSASSVALMEQPAQRHSRETSRFAMSKLSKKKLTSHELIYGSTTGIAANCAKQMNVGSRFRSASMQRSYPIRPAPNLIQLPKNNNTEILYHPEYTDLDRDEHLKNPYAATGGSHYGHLSHASSSNGVGHRRRANSKNIIMMNDPYGQQPQTAGGQQVGRISGSAAPTPTGATANYDMGRSSSGIYGNNSSSSSCDYADWHPQMRKVNSSGYLNSIFKNHQPQANGAGNHNNINNNINNSSNNNQNNNTNMLNNNNNSGNNGLTKPRGYSTSGRPIKLQQTSNSVINGKSAHKAEPKQQILGSSMVDNRPLAYRSYDSSNDSEPSYTNSSDGLDFYDHIGRINNHNQFLDDVDNLTPEVHVGEWENMYDR